MATREKSTFKQLESLWDSLSHAQQKTFAAKLLSEAEARDALTEQKLDAVEDFRRDLAATDRPAIEACTPELKGSDKQAELLVRNICATAAQESAGSTQIVSVSFDVEVQSISAREKASRLATAIAAFAAFIAVSGCALFEPRIDVMPIAQATAQMPPAMREAMRDLSSPATTAALHRAQASVEASVEAEK